MGASNSQSSFTPKILSITASIGMPRLEEDQAALKGWHQAFPDVVIVPEKLIAEGDLVTVYWIARGTNTGTGNGLPATGKKAELAGITIWRIVEGKIKEEWSAFDQLSMMHPLGLLPANK
jgi:predicted ester cyclase